LRGTERDWTRQLLRYGIILRVPFLASANQTAISVSPVARNFPGTFHEVVLAFLVQRHSSCYLETEFFSPRVNVQVNIDTT